MCHFFKNSVYEVLPTEFLHKKNNLCRFFSLFLNAQKVCCFKNLYVHIFMKAIKTIMHFAYLHNMHIGIDEVKKVCKNYLEIFSKRRRNLVGDLFLIQKLGRRIVVCDCFDQFRRLHHYKNIRKLQVTN